MGSDCVDICDSVMEKMCGECPHFKKCHGDEDEDPACAGEANHDQMLVCLSLILKPTVYSYPTELTYPYEKVE
jgi:hypothetical protein